MSESIKNKARKRLQLKNISTDTLNQRLQIVKSRIFNEARTQPDFMQEFEFIELVLTPEFISILSKYKPVDNSAVISLYLKYFSPDDEDEDDGDQENKGSENKQELENNYSQDVLDEIEQNMEELFDDKPKKTSNKEQVMKEKQEIEQRILVFMAKYGKFIIDEINHHNKMEQLQTKIFQKNIYESKIEEAEEQEDEFYGDDQLVQTQEHSGSKENNNNDSKMYEVNKKYKKVDGGTQKCGKFNDRCGKAVDDGDDGEEGDYEFGEDDLAQYLDDNDI